MILLKSWRFLMITALACFPLLIGVETTWADPASETINLLFDAGRSDNSLILRPIGKQQFAQTVVNGLPCIQLVSDNVENEESWNFDVADNKWFDKSGDALVVIEYIASETDIRWMHYDSDFHTFHQFDSSVFFQEIRDDVRFAQLLVHKVSLGNDVYRSIFRLKKVRFANRLSANADFCFFSRRKMFVGIRAIRLRLTAKKQDENTHMVSCEACLHHLYRNLLRRNPETWEIAKAKNAIQSGQTKLFFFIRNLLQTSEFLENNYYSSETTDGIKRIFRLTCARNPTSFEINNFFSLVSMMNIDFALRVFIEKYYTEMLENIVKMIDLDKKMKNQ